MLAINPKIKQKAEDIRKKIFGSEVRESLASGIEAISEDVEATIGRQDYVEEQFQNVIDETTDKDVISAPELIAARNGKSNLKTRLDDEHAEVTAQLQQKATKTLLADGFYAPEIMPAIDGSADINADTIKSSDMYNLYDNLVDRFPNYITRELVAMDASNTLPIYRYIFSASPSNDVLIVESNMHGHGTGGDPKDASIILYYFMRDLCERWQSDKHLNKIRWETTLVVIPVLNPWGYDNDSRYNSNDVDINRNFDWNWSGQTSEYKGTAPLSEPETRAIVDTVKKYLTSEASHKVLGYISFHAYANLGTGFQFPYALAPTTPMVPIFRKVGSYLQQKYNSIVSDNVSGGTASSSDNYMEKVLGIPAGTAELSIFRRDGQIRTSQAVTQNVEYYGNLIVQTIIGDLRPKGKISMFEQTEQMIITEPRGTLIKFRERFNDSIFSWDDETGEIIVPAGVHLIRIKAQFQLHYNSPTAVDIGYSFLLERDGGNGYGGRTVKENYLKMGGESIATHHTVTLESPILNVIDGARFRVTAFTNHKDGILKTNANNQLTWIEVSEYVRDWR